MKSAVSFMTVLFSCLAAWTVPAPAAAEMLDWVALGGTRIETPVPEGFTRLEATHSLVQNYFQGLIDGAAAKAVYITHEDARALREKRGAKLERYFVLLSWPGEDERPQGRGDFAARLAKTDLKARALLWDIDSVLAESAKNSGKKSGQLRRGEFVPVSINASSATSFSLTQLQVSSVPRISTGVITRVRGKSLLLVADSLYRDDSDALWTRSESDNWASLLVNANPRITPPQGLGPNPATFRARSISFRYPARYRQEDYRGDPGVIKLFTADDDGDVTPGITLYLRTPTPGLERPQTGWDITREFIRGYIDESVNILAAESTEVNGVPGFAVRLYTERNDGGKLRQIYALAYFFFHKDGDYLLECVLESSDLSRIELAARFFNEYEVTFIESATTISFSP